MQPGTQQGGAGRHASTQMLVLAVVTAAMIPLVVVPPGTVAASEPGSSTEDHEPGDTGRAEQRRAEDPPPHGEPPNITTTRVPATVSEPRVQTRSASSEAGPTAAEEPTPSITTGDPLIMSEEADPPPQAPTSSSGDLGSAAPGLDTSFLSSNIDDDATHTGGFEFIPADPHAAAGPNQLVNVVNVLVAANDKGGSQLFEGSLADFFADLSPLTFTFDPKVVFDHYAGRFVVVTLEQTDDGAGGQEESSRIFVAVSDTADPRDGWTVTDIDAKTTIGGTDHWADYPGLAVDEEAVYIAANMFGFSADGGGFGGVRLWMIDKGHGTGGLYDGGPAAVSKINPYTDPESLASTTQPALMSGEAPGDVGTFLVSHDGLTDGTNEYVQVVRIDDPLGTPTLDHEFVPVGNIDALSAPVPDAPQSGSSLGIDMGDRRALDAVWVDDSLWMTATIVPRPGTADAGQATAHWWQLDTSTLGATSLADQGNLLGEDIAAGTYTGWGSIAVNDTGHVAFGFAGSSGTIHPGSYYTTRLPSTPAGGTTGSGTLRQGQGAYELTFCSGSNRWGDYTGTVVDPADGSFWVYNKHSLTTVARESPCPAESSEDGRWGTAYGNFSHADACATDRVLAGDVLGGTQTLVGGSSVRAVDGVSVNAGSNVTFHAGDRVVLFDGFSVTAGGTTFTATVDPPACP